MNTLKKLTALCSFALLIVCMSNCSTLRKMNSSNKESLLLASGYKMVQATTPKQISMLKAMPPYKTVVRHKNGKTLYTYANPKQSVLYIGKPSNYRTYKKLALQQSMQDDEIIDESDMNAEMMDWGVWGPGWY